MTDEAKRCVEALRDNINNGFLLVGGFNESVHASEIIHLIESMSAQLEQVEKERDGLNIMLAQAQAMLETRTKERDAAIADMQKTPITLCEACAHYHTGYPCSGGKYIDKINITVACTMFKWRGVREVE